MCNYYNSPPASELPRVVEDLNTKGAKELGALSLLPAIPSFFVYRRSLILSRLRRVRGDRLWQHLRPCARRRRYAAQYLLQQCVVPRSFPMFI